MMKRVGYSGMMGWICDYGDGGIFFSLFYFLASPGAKWCEFVGLGWLAGSFFQIVGWFRLV